MAGLGEGQGAPLMTGAPVSPSPNPATNRPWVWGAVAPQREGSGEGSALPGSPSPPSPSSRFSPSPRAPRTRGRWWRGLVRIGVGLG